MNVSTAPPPTLRLALTVLAPFSAGYFLSYMFRAINAVVAPDLVRDIGLSASELGVLTAAYLIAFALFQLPLGVLLDRFGPRRVQTALLLTAAAGSVLFSVGGNAIVLTVARALIGLGFAGGLMAGFKAVVLWYPPARHALANSCIMSFGGLGMVVATVPAELTIQLVGWRGLFVVTASITLAIAAIIFLVVPERDGAAEPRPLAQEFLEIGAILRDRFFWHLAPFVAIMAGSHIAIHTLWAGPWFRDVAGYDRDGVALLLLMLAVAFLVGTLVFGLATDRAGRRGIDQLHIVTAAAVVFMLTQLLILFHPTATLVPVWFLFGMTGQSVVLSYPRLSQHFGAGRSGRAQTAANLVVFATAFGAQALIGAVIDLFPPTASGGYAPAGYDWGFGALLVLQALALVWYLYGVFWRAPAGG